MTENLLAKNPTNGDLLTKIQRETHERLRELRGAVDEHERLTAELSALQDVPEPPVVRERPVNVVPFPARPRLQRTRMVSPKVARLMRAPRRPALERSGVVRVSTRENFPPGDDPFPAVDPQGIDEVDLEAERYEHSL